MLVLLMAQVTKQGMDIGTVHSTQIIQRREDTPCHLQRECSDSESLRISLFFFLFLTKLTFKKSHDVSRTTCLTSHIEFEII